MIENFCRRGKLFQTIAILSIFICGVLCGEETFKCPKKGEAGYKSRGQYLKKDDTTCKSYWQCNKESNSSTSETCPDGQKFVDFECYDEKNVDCPLKVSCEGQNDRFPDKNDKSRYYRCVFTAPIHENCTGGMKFDATYQNCFEDLKDFCAKKDNKGKVVKTTADDKYCVFYVDCKDTKTIKLCPKNQRYQFKGNNVGCFDRGIIDCSDFDCPEANGNFAIEGQKTKYYECKNSSPFFKSCGNKEFDKDKKACKS